MAQTRTRHGATSWPWHASAPGSTARRSDTVLVGDTPLDVRAAREAGARSIAVASGPYGLEALREAGADQVLADLGDTPTGARRGGSGTKREHRSCSVRDPQLRHDYRHAAERESRPDKLQWACALAQHQVRQGDDHHRVEGGEHRDEAHEALARGRGEQGVGAHVEHTDGEQGAEVGAAQRESRADGGDQEREQCHARDPVDQDRPERVGLGGLVHPHEERAGIRAQPRGPGPRR